MKQTSVGRRGVRSLSYGQGKVSSGAGKSNRELRKMIALEWVGRGIQQRKKKKKKAFNNNNLNCYYMLDP